MAKFSRFDPRNKKDGRHKKQVLEGKGKRKGSSKNYYDEENEKYLKKYRKYAQDEFA